MAQEKKEQKTWKEFGYLDLREESEEHAKDAPDLLDAGDSKEDAVKVLETAFGFSVGISVVSYETAIGKVSVSCDFLPHIAEKRKDARERYTNFAVDTMTDPYEIWKVTYEDGDLEFYRLLFIGFFKAKNQMLVSVDIRGDSVLWNFMQQDKKSLNKHRHGERIFCRYS